MDAGIIMAAIVALAAAFLGPAFEFLPRAALSAIMVVAVADLIDLLFREAFSNPLLDRANDQARFEVEAGSEVEADLVVMGVGIVPNTELAKSAGLHCERGIVVNDVMQTFDPRIYAVGESAQHRGIEHCWHHAAQRGRRRRQRRGLRLRRGQRLGKAASREPKAATGDDDYVTDSNLSR